MTTKQIAESVGKDPATVARWIQSVSCKVQEVSCKVQEARATSKPADYTIAEVCQIIEEGLGKAAADVYRTNATHAEMQKPQKTKYSAAYIREVRLSLGKEAAARLLTGEPAHVPATRPLALPAPSFEWPDEIPRKLQQQVYAVLVSGLKKVAREERDREDTPELFK
jgi:transposase